MGELHRQGHYDWQKIRPTPHGLPRPPSRAVLYKGKQVFVDDRPLYVRFRISFDNTNGLVLGLTFATCLPCPYRLRSSSGDDTGARTSGLTPSLAGRGHIFFVRTDYYGLRIRSPHEIGRTMPLAVSYDGLGVTSNGPPPPGALNGQCSPKGGMCRPRGRRPFDDELSRRPRQLRM